jgi:predicted amidohydrolase
MLLSLPMCRRVAATFLVMLALDASATPLSSASENGNLIENPHLQVDADGQAAGWSRWTPRPTLAPEFRIVADPKAPALEIHSPRFECYGKWLTFVRDIQPGKFYAIEADSSARGVEFPEMSVKAVASWFRESSGSGELQRDYLDQIPAADGWTHHAAIVQAPAETKCLRLELCLHSTAGGSVAWRAVQVHEVPPPPPRLVKIVTTQIKPPLHSTIAQNMELMAKMLDTVGPQKPDIVLFSENLVDRNVPVSLAEKVQPVPGPLVEMLAAKARQYHTYVATTLHEVSADKLYYNTAILIDREGKLVGKYRKVHLAIVEIDWGLSPGTEYPVFATDFGRIGLMTCYDDWFGETARILRINGAEMIFLPIAGDTVPHHWEAVSRTRAIDNGVYLVSSATVTDNETQIINPMGEVLATATGDFGYAAQTVDLRKRWPVKYLSVAEGTGDPMSLYLQERRPDTYEPLMRPAAEPKTK